MLINRIAYLMRRRSIYRYYLPNRLWDAGSRIPENNRLEVVFPNRTRTLVSIGCPIARVVSKMDDGDAFFADSPRNIRNDLLNEREEADIPLANNMQPHWPIVYVLT